MILALIWVALHAIVVYIKGITARESEEDQEFIIFTSTNGAVLLQNKASRYDTLLQFLSNLTFLTAGLLSLLPGSDGINIVTFLMLGAGLNCISAVLYRLNRRRVLSYYLKESVGMSVPEPKTAENRRVYKPWWESKTIWFQLFTVLVAGLTLAIDLQDQIGFPDNYRAYILIVVAMINVYLRGITGQPVSKDRK